MHCGFYFADPSARACGNRACFRQRAKMNCDTCATHLKGICTVHCVEQCRFADAMFHPAFATDHNGTSGGEILQHFPSVQGTPDEVIRHRGNRAPKCRVGRHLWYWQCSRRYTGPHSGETAPRGLAVTTWHDRGNRHLGQRSGGARATRHSPAGASNIRRSA